MPLKSKIIFGAVVALIAIQFIQPKQNKSAEMTDADIEKIYTMPPNVKAILSRSCYDCHSNHTRYPWYGGLQPAAWYMAKHINDGKAALNFSAFGTYAVRKQRNKLRAVANQVKDGAMPLPSYTFIHHDANLSPNDKQVLTMWLNAVSDSIK